MTPFKAPVDDIFFSLREIAGAGDLPDWDADLSQEITSHFASFAEGALAPLNEVGDREGCRLENGRVRMPDGFGTAYQELAESGWQGLTAPERFGGQDMDHLTAAAISEIFSGANHALQMVTGLVPGAVSTLLNYGSEDQQAAYIPKLASGEWLSTMCLTEPQAGSDLSTIRTKAEQTDDGWALTGEKIFISGGDQDMSDGILHLVLARTGDKADGVKGLSLFVCPSEVDGVRNGVSVTRIEEKMGLHASPTCQLAFEGATAELMGEEGGGLAAMFTMMNHARLDVALQGVAHAARAHDIAKTYAAERKQGRKADGSPAVLADHPDVQRMLDEQQILAQGARAMCHIALVALERGEQPALVEFLTSLCKYFGSDAGIKAADLGMQVLGGYGYLEEYGLSQVWRDARITSIYEGANGIHALTLATRGLKLDGGKGADDFAALVADLGGETPEIATKLDTWRGLRAEVEAHERPAELAHSFAEASARLFLAAIWLRMAEAAKGTERAEDCDRLLARLLKD
ncbi:acyl-CoA dehydrogenase family protein [Paracoccaceae bacterium GXU_MW_L88]